jgi:DNA-3-methyladenine glycosylase
VACSHTHRPWSPPIPGIDLSRAPAAPGVTVPRACVGSGFAVRPPRTPAPGALPVEFYARPVLEVARSLIGCVVEHRAAAGVIVETEAYHESEPACHAFIGLTPRTRTLFGGPGRAYVYRSYGIHSLLNAVCEQPGVGAAVLIRALEPLRGIARMRERRAVHRREELCSGPGKLTVALAVELLHNDCDLTRGPVTIRPPRESWLAERHEVIAAPRIGITKAVELPWRFCLAGNPHVSRPRPG